MVVMGGNSRTWLTYGAPNLATNKCYSAYSVTFDEHLPINVNPKYSLNAYAISTKSHGAADSLNKAPDFGRQIFNRKK